MNIQKVALRVYVGENYVNVKCALTLQLDGKSSQNMYYILILLCYPNFYPQLQSCLTSIEYKWLSLDCSGLHQFLELPKPYSERSEVSSFLLVNALRKLEVVHAHGSEDMQTILGAKCLLSLSPLAITVVSHHHPLLAQPCFLLPMATPSGNTGSCPVSSFHNTSLYALVID